MNTEASSDVVVRTPIGVFTLNSVHDARMVAHLSQQKKLHEQLLRVATAYVAGGVAIDVGAHVGTASVPLARIAERVVAFEANGATFNYLKQNITHNKVSIDARNVGLGDRPGRASVQIVNAHNAGANTLTAGDDIAISTLDAEVDTADFLKIDVEGMELAVLKGGEKLFARSRPVVWFEVNIKQLRAHDARISHVARWFSEHEYELYFPIMRDQALVLGRADSLSLITFLITPRAYLFSGHCMPFDVVALPRERAVHLPTRPTLYTLGYLVWRQIMQKLGRVVYPQ